MLNTKVHILIKKTFADKNLCDFATFAVSRFLNLSMKVYVGDFFFETSHPQKFVSTKFFKTGQLRILTFAKLFKAGYLRKVMSAKFKNRTSTNLYLRETMNFVNFTNFHLFLNDVAQGY